MNSGIQKKADEYFAKAIAAKNVGRLKYAKTWFIKSASISKGKGRSVCWIFAGYCNKELGSLSEALSSLRKAERYNPQSSFVQLYIGILQLSLNRPRLAERAFRKSIKLRPSASAYILLGSALCRQRHRQNIKACYRSALRLKPNNEEAHYNLGVQYKFEGKFSKAERHLRYATKIDPQYATAYAELGNVLFKRKLFPQARTVLRRSIKLDPGHYWARLYLAITNWVLRRLKEAEGQYMEALKIAPADSLANSCFGDFLSSEGRANAEHFLKNGISLNTKNDVAHYHMGKHLWRNNREREAKPFLRKAAHLGHKRALQLLTELTRNNS